MKFKAVDERGECVMTPKGKHVYETVIWSDHQPGCKQCREVDIEHSATFVRACAHPGAALLNEALMVRQTPVVKQKAAEVREWAKRAGVFKGA